MRTHGMVSISRYLTDSMTEDPFLAKHKKLNEAITDLIENYGLVSTNTE